MHFSSPTQAILTVLCHTEDLAVEFVIHEAPSNE